jgi:protein-S-isoprenylcysteine O-methyltransferase Ste14
VRVPTAALGSAAFFVAAPVIVAGVLPWSIAHATPAADAAPPLTEIVGWLLIAIGALALVDSFVRFVRQGRGTPAPVAPTEELVVTGLYRYVRNPMYLAVLAVVLGQAVLFWSPGVLLYACIVAAAVVTFVRTYEEPTLSARYGDQYADYVAAVPGWVPRLTPGWPPSDGS